MPDPTQEPPAQLSWLTCAAGSLVGRWPRFAEPSFPKGAAAARPQHGTVSIGLRTGLLCAQPLLPGSPEG